jgi:hypothetical protein
MQANFDLRDCCARRILDLVVRSRGAICRSVLLAQQRIGVSFWHMRRLNMEMNL